MEMLAKQKAIYEGLKNIGEEVSNLYADAIRILHSDDIVSKSYLIAHIAREIDSGIREILAPVAEQEEKRKEPEFKDRGNLVSILVALDLPLDDPFAIQYHKVAKQFHKFAHKQGAYGKPRSLNLFLPLWNDYEDILLNLVGSFINQLKRIERLIKYEFPSKQILLTLPNIFRDEKKERHFYTNLKKESWFDPLYKNEFFSPKTIRDDFYWNQSEYLEELSLGINKGEVSKEVGESLALLAEEILSYSQNVEYLNNYRIRYTLLKILTNIPKKYISDNIVSLIPHCVKTKHENILESSQIFDFYFSFLIDKDEIPKYKEILERLTKLIFGISEEEQFKDNSSYDSGDYYSYIRAYRLKEACENPKFINAVASNCSNDVIFFIADNLDKYLNSSDKYIIESIFSKNELNNYAYSVKSNFTLILINSCIEIAKISGNRISFILKTFLTNRYTHQRLLQISLYIIAKTWSITKHIFFDFIRDLDKNKLFSNHLVSDDLYYFLEEIATRLNETEAQQIETIIEQGSQEEDFYNHGGQYYDDFRLRWYSALSESKYLHSKYQEVSSKKGKAESEIHPKNNEFITHGSISPLTKTDIINMSTTDLVEYLKTFDPERSFRSPSVDGLEGSLTEVIKLNPTLFTENYTSFLEVPYRYIFRIFYALSDCHKEGKEINWKNILLFIKKYTSQKIFGTEKLTLKNASFKYDNAQVVKSMCRLLSDGMRNDKTAFSDKLLPQARLILFSFTKNYVSNELSEKDKGVLGSAMQVINSTTGVVVGTMLDYSLRRARILKESTTIKKWSKEEKLIFNSFAEEGVQEFFVRFGWNLGNFFYLDKGWSKLLLKSIPTKDLQTRMSFFGGHIINLSSSSFEYDTLKTIYEEAIIKKWKVVDSTMGNSPLETQLLIFFISGYENLEKSSLLAKYLEQKNLKSIKGMIHSLSFKFEKYYQNLEPEKQISFRNKIVRIWEYVLEILEQSKDDDAQDFGILIHLSKYVEELNENTTSLFLRSGNFSSKNVSIEIVLKSLNRYKNKGNKKESLVYASQIFENLILKEAYYASILKEEIIDFVEDLYKDGREELKNRADYICNEFVKKGQYELRELYEKYN